MRRVLLRLIVAVTLIAGSFPASVQAQEAKSNFGLNLNVFGNYYLSHSGVDQALPDDWSSNFYPHNGDMTLDRNNGNSAVEIGLGIEPTWKKDELTIGLPIFYSYGLSQTGFNRDLRVAGTDVNWWDVVPVLEVCLRKTAPAIGLSFKKGQWKIQGSIQPYKILLVDYEGVDVFGGANYSKAIKRTEIGSGVGQRLTVYYFPDDPDDEWNSLDKGALSFDAFYERDGSQVWLVGIGFNYAYRLVE